MIGGLAREVVPARMRPGWRLAVALPIAIALAIGGIEAGHAVLVALRTAADHAAPAAAEVALDVGSAWMEREYSAGGDCGHGAVLVAAMAIVGVAALLGVLIGAVISAGLGRREDRSGHGDDGDGGDEDEIDLPFDPERVVVIAVPRREAPGAPEPGKTETN